MVRRTPRLSGPGLNRELFRIRGFSIQGSKRANENRLYASFRTSFLLDVLACRRLIFFFVKCFSLMRKTRLLSRIVSQIPSLLVMT
jgi:hypothetical protein